MSNESRQLSHMSARDMKLSGAVLGRVGVAPRYWSPTRGSL